MHDGLIFIGWPQLYFKANATVRRQSTLTRSTQPEEPGVSLVVGERQISPSVKKTSNLVVVRCSLKELFIESYAQYDIFVYVLLFVCQGISALSTLSKIQSCDCKITSSGIRRSIRSYWDPGTQKFKSVTRDPLKFNSGTQGLPPLPRSKFKNGTPQYHIQKLGPWDFTIL